MTCRRKEKAIWSACAYEVSRASRPATVICVSVIAQPFSRKYRSDRHAWQWRQELWRQERQRSQSREISAGQLDGFGGASGQGLETYLPLRRRRPPGPGSQIAPRSGREVPNP
jgi:hypothetical protein